MKIEKTFAWERGKNFACWTQTLVGGFSKPSCVSTISNSEDMHNRVLTFRLLCLSCRRFVRTYRGILVHQFEHAAGTSSCVNNSFIFSARSLCITRSHSELVVASVEADAKTHPPVPIRIARSFRGLDGLLASRALRVTVEVLQHIRNRLNKVGSSTNRSDGNTYAGPCARAHNVPSLLARASKVNSLSSSSAVGPVLPRSGGVLAPRALHRVLQ